MMKTRKDRTVAGVRGSTPGLGAMMGRAPNTAPPPAGGSGSRMLSGTTNVRRREGYVKSPGI